MTRISVAHDARRQTLEVAVLFSGCTRRPMRLYILVLLARLYFFGSVRRAAISQDSMLSSSGASTARRRPPPRTLDPMRELLRDVQRLVVVVGVLGRVIDVLGPALGQSGLASTPSGPSASVHARAPVLRRVLINLGVSPTRRRRRRRRAPALSSPPSLSRRGAMLSPGCPRRRARPPATPQLVVWVQRVPSAARAALPLISALSLSSKLFLCHILRPTSANLGCRSLREDAGRALAPPSRGARGFQASGGSAAPKACPAASAPARVAHTHSPGPSGSTRPGQPAHEAPPRPPARDLGQPPHKHSKPPPASAMSTLTAAARAAGAKDTSDHGRQPGRHGQGLLSNTRHQPRGDGCGGDQEGLPAN